MSDLIKIISFPEELFYLERMVGYEKEPKVIIQIRMEKEECITISTGFKSVVKCVSSIDSSKTSNERVTVNLKVSIKRENNERESTQFINQSEAYRLLSYSLREEIEAFLKLQVDELIRAMKEDKLEELMSS